MFEIPAALLAWFYSVTHNYAISIALIAVVVMAIITPLTLKSTKGMLEMQRLAPEMRKLQQLHRNDRQKLNEEMMKLYQEHKVNPMSSCLPLLAQMPVFLIMFRILHGLTYSPTAAAAPIVKTIYSAAGQDIPTELGFVPRYISHTSDLYTSLFGQTEMVSFGLDLAKSPAEALSEGLASGLDLRLAGRRPGRAVLPAAADGRRPGGRQPDDVAGAAEADAVPARGLRRLPGVLPHRPDHLLHGPGRAADRPAGLHHAPLLRARGVPRPAGAAGQRPRPGVGQEGRRRRRSVRPAQAQGGRHDRHSGAGESAGEEGGRRAAAGDEQADDGPEGSTDADRQGRRGAPEVRIPIGTAGGQPQQERWETTALTGAARSL